MKNFVSHHPENAQSIESMIISMKNIIQAMDLPKIGSRLMETSSSRLEAYMLSVRSEDYKPWLMDKSISQIRKQNKVSPVSQSRSGFTVANSMTLRNAIAKITLPSALMLAAALVTPVSALDNEIMLQQAPGVFVMRPGPEPRLPARMIGTFILVMAGIFVSVARNLLGPLMGISSVLWFVMRNDTAVRPGFSWAVFCVWSVVTLTYLFYQTRRVALEKLYILLTMAFAGVCLCIIGLVQKSSIQGGLVTAIPPCTSFAAYAVAFVFPDRRHTSQDIAV